MPGVSVASRLRDAFESGDFEPLRPRYASDALLDWSMPGRRERANGPDEILALLGEWWPGARQLTRWEAQDFPVRLTIEFERRRRGPGRAAAVGPVARRARRPSPGLRASGCSA